MAGDNNYTLGRGKVHFAQFRPNTQVPRGERYFGNTPELGYSAEQENLDHYSSDEGVRVKDESVLLQLDYAGSFATDNVSFENLAIFFLGETLIQTVASSTVPAEIHTGVELGFSYQLGASDAMPAGVRQVSAVTVKGVGASPTTYVLNEDYTVDLVLGRVTILEGGAIEADTDISVGYTVEAHSIEQTISKSRTIEGAMRYIASNPAGKQIDYYMPWVKITPNGDFALKGDEWQTLPFNLEILKKAGREAIYMNGRPYTP